MVKLKNNFKITYYEFIYFTAMMLFVVVNFISVTSLLDFDNNFKQIVIYILKTTMILLLLFKFFYYDKFLFKDVCKILGVVIVILISYVITKGDDLLWLYFFIVTAKNLNFDKIVKFLTFSYFLGVLVVVMFSVCGIISSIEVVTENPITKQLVTRRLLGFKHVNFLGGYILLTYFGFLYMRFRTFNIRDCVVSLVTSLILYMYINSKTSCVLIVLSSVFVYLTRFLIKYNCIYILKRIIYLVMIISLLLSIVLSIGYQKYYDQIKKIDYILSYRIKWGNYFFEEYGFSLLGRQVTLVSTIEAQKTGEKLAILDNAYMHLLVRYGIAATCILIANYFIIVSQAFKQKNYHLALIIMLLFIAGITEKWLFMIQYNYFLIATLPVFEKELNKGNKKNEKNFKRILSEF